LADVASARGDHDKFARLVLAAAALEDLRHAERPWLKPKPRRRRR
jgi:hypothetical protein